MVTFGAAGALSADRACGQQLLEIGAWPLEDLGRMLPVVDVGGDQQVELELDVDVLQVLAVADEPTSGSDEVRRLALQQAAEVGKLRHRPRTRVSRQQYDGTLGTEIGGDGEPAADGAELGSFASEELEELFQISGLWPFHGPQQF